MFTFYSFAYKFSTSLIIFLIFYTTVLHTIHVVVYRNAYFNPTDTLYILSNLSNISSVNACLCQCSHITICSTATYFGNTQQCILFFAQLHQGQLQMVPIQADTAVYSFTNRSLGDLTMFKSTNETFNALWNTTAGGDSSFASPGTTIGTYWPTEIVQNVFDGDLTSTYTSHGMCNSNFAAVACGEKTGFYLITQGEPMILVAFCLGTNIYFPTRDPLSVTIEGSNSNGPDLQFGSSWTLIYNGSSGLITDPGRAVFGATQLLTHPTMPFISYRFLVTSKRGYQTSASYSEVQLVFAYTNSSNDMGDFGNNS